MEPLSEHDLLTIADSWSLPRPFRVRPAPGGINNDTRFLDTDNGSYVLRVYRHVRDTARARYEHAILVGLQPQDLSFRVPVPVPLRVGPSSVSGAVGVGDTLAALPGGALAALFPVLEGGPLDRTDPDHIRAFGAALAELHAALRRIDVGPPPVGMPTYGSLVMPDVPRPWEIAHQPPLEDLLDGARREHLFDIAGRLRTDVVRHYNPLPAQLCHNDCGPGNALAVDGRVSAILDFEFAGPDRRAIDVAVAWYWSVGPAWGSGNELPAIRALFQGYASVASLTPVEMEAMPCLARLQRYASLVHWTGRHRAGTSTEERTREQAQRLLDLDRWLDDHAEELLGICQGTP